MSTPLSLSPEAESNLQKLGWGEWVQTAQSSLPRTLQAHGLKPLAPLWGGKMGFCCLARDPQGQQVVVKSMPDPFVQRQALALEAMRGWHAPKLLGQDPERGILWTLFLPGEDRPEEYKEMEIVDMLAAWQVPAPAGLPSVAERFAYWVDFLGEHNRDSDIDDIIQRTDQLLSQMPEGDRLLHGDLSWYNLLRHQDGKLYALDPAGCRGSVEWDIACMSIYHGPQPERERSEDMLERYCVLLGANYELAREYCAVRTAFSLARSVRREEWNKVDQDIKDYHYWVSAR